MLDQLAHARDISRDHGHAGCERLQHRIGAPLRAAGQDKGITNREVIHNPVRVDGACENHTITDTEPMCQIFQLNPLHPIPDHNEAGRAR